MRDAGGLEGAAAGRLGVLGSFMALLREAVGAEAAGPIGFCDQDDVWLPDKLARGATAVAGDTPALYCARQTLVDAGLRPIGESPPIRHAGFPAALTQNIAAGCTIVMNHAAARLVATSSPPPGTLHDWWSYLVVAASGGRIVADDKPTILYRQHAANVVGAPTSHLRRAVAALRRGPAAFIGSLRSHVSALRAQENGFTAEARADLAALDAALSQPPWRRLGVLRRRGLRRQTALETAVFRAWVLFG